MMMTRLVIIAELSLMLAITPAFAEEPVMIGRDVGYDACGAISETKVKTNVRSEPNIQSSIVEVLEPGIRVWDCDWKEVNGESWSGVVYSLEPGKDCGPMGTPIPRAIQYVGPCSYGWINREDLTFIAG